MVRTGMPPCSRITSGTAREQIRLYSMVAPGSVRSTAAARSAVVVEPLMPVTGLVDDEHAVGVAVERQPDVEPAAT